MRIFVSLLAGWIAGGLVFYYFFHQPLECLAPVLAFSTTAFLMVILK